MRANGVRRLVVVTASSHVRDRRDDFAPRALARPILRPMAELHGGRGGLGLPDDRNFKKAALRGI